MKNWIDTELIPSVFEVIDSVLPEHDFKPYAGGWKSKTYLDGTPHKDRSDKTVITKKVPSLILEQGGETISLINYVMRRDGLNFYEVIKKLANAVNIGFPEDSLFNPESYQKQKDELSILEECTNYFTWCLHNSTGSRNVIAYLTNRGYSIDDIKAMDLGYIPSQEQLHAYLIQKGYSEYVIENFIHFKKDSRIGESHCLTIPYRSGGTIKGFKFRSMVDCSPKYLNSHGLDRMRGFFNISALKGSKDLVIVEGELDALHATAKGLLNIVATGGSSVSKEQIQDAKRRGAKSFSIALDHESDKSEETAKKTNAIIEILLAEHISKIYVVSLPPLEGNKTDPDRLIKECGIDTFKKVIFEASPYYRWQLQSIINKYVKVEAERSLEYRDLNAMLDEVVETAAKIIDPMDRDQYKKLFISTEWIKTLGITASSLDETVDRLTFDRKKEAQAKELRRVLSEVSGLQEKGETLKAIDLLQQKAKTVKSSFVRESDSLRIPKTIQDIRNKRKNNPKSIYSGYTIGSEELFFQAGAISIIAAPTSHGKTSFLTNLALNVCKTYPDKEAYFFSFEEDYDAILVNALNMYMDCSVGLNNRKEIKRYFDSDFPEQHRQIDQHARSFFSELVATNKLNVNYVSLNSDALIDAIRDLKKKTNIGSVFIDYIQLLRKDKKGFSRHEELKQICLDLKDLAIETGLPIILGAQFNREVVNPLRIHATKIGEAGDIERIANVIVGFWNTNFKSQATDSEIKEIGNIGACEPNSMYAILLKNRGGRAGLEEIFEFNGNTGRIKNKTKKSDFSYFSQLEFKQK